MDIFGSNFVDAGAGNGVVMACAIAVGAGKATGYELPENDAHRFIFAALMSRVFCRSSSLETTGY
jgi:predicted RNA methylase